VKRSSVAPLFYAVASFLLAVIAFTSLTSLGLTQAIGIDPRQLLEPAAVIVTALMIGAPVFFILVFIVELGGDRRE
jgi:hypothetical protein